MQLVTGPTYTEEEERLEKEAGPSRLVGGCFNKQGNLYMRLVLDRHEIADLGTHPLEFKSLYRGLKWGSVTSTVHMVSIAHCSLKTASLKQLQLWQQ